jgi:trans-aconitate methyltransferase
MQLRDAVDLLAPANLPSHGPLTWVDLGAGDGTFTRALAECLAPGSVIHAIDRDRVALRAIPATQGDVAIRTHDGDFTQDPWPWAPAELDGILMANSLHYVAGQQDFLARCRRKLQPPHRFLIVEYDTDSANPWVPFPISSHRLHTLFTDAPAPSILWLGTRPSRYQRAALYAALITS